MNKLQFLTLGIAILLANIAYADESFSLDILLQTIKSGHHQDMVDSKTRLDRFYAENNARETSLELMRLALNKEEKKAKRFEQTFSENDQTIANLDAALISRMGTLKELLGTVQQTALATQGQFENSITQLEFAERVQKLERLRSQISSSNKLISVSELEDLWFELQREMTESSKVKTLDIKVLNEHGIENSQSVTRIGLFNLISEVGYLTFNPATGRVSVLKSPPSRKHTNYIEAFFNSKDDYAKLSIDPTRGQLLELLTRVPDLNDRVGQGGFIGYFIIFLGFVGLLITIERLVSLRKTKKEIQIQIDTPNIIQNNPMGRILKAYKECFSSNLETIELRLSEALLHEIPLVKRRLIFLKTIAVVAPLLGLLGTVTGMIITFQSITLFGTGDPKLMAGGISQALVTTALGLTTAIPILLAHTLLGTRVTAINQLLEEEVTGLIAKHNMSKTASLD